METDGGPSFRSVLIVEGGALRGVFSTGLLDGFLEASFNPFDFYIGVSSGASNLAAYLAGMNGRNRRIFLDYSLRPMFIDPFRFLRGGHLLDLDWLWDITIREVRLDLAAIYGQCKPFIVVMTNIRTGRAYYKETAFHNLEDVLKASSAMPVFYRNYPLIDGHPMTDGGVADALPVDEAIRRGARCIMVVRSRPFGYVKRSGSLDRFFSWSIRRYPRLQQAQSDRVKRYNDAVALMREPPHGVSIVEICPPDSFPVSRLTRNRKHLEAGYEQGKAMAPTAIRRWTAVAGEGGKSSPDSDRRS